MDADALVITLPARRSGPAMSSIYKRYKSWWIARWPIVFPALFYQLDICLWRRARHGERNHPRNPVTNSGRVLEELEDWLHNLPGTSVDILRLAGGRTGTSSRTLLCRKTALMVNMVLI